MRSTTMGSPHQEEAKSSEQPSVACNKREEDLQESHSTRRPVTKEGRCGVDLEEEAEWAVQKKRGDGEDVEVG